MNIYALIKAKTLATLPSPVRYSVQHLRHRAYSQELRTRVGGNDLCQAEWQDYSLVGFDELRCIFVHIPKTGGISVARSLFGHLGGGHQTVQDYQILFGPFVFRRYFKFTFVRNPYSRLVSAYNFLKSGGFDEVDRQWSINHLSPYDSFKDFVCDWVNDSSVWTKHHFRPQYSYVCDNGHGPMVDFVGRFERLQHDFDYVCKRLGRSTELLHANSMATNTGNYREYYCDETQAIVADVYRRDFEIFGYSTDIYN